MAVSVVAKFIADEWFKIMAILCFLVFVVSMTVDLKVDNALVGLFSLAGLLWGIGEMACRPLISGITTHPDVLGPLHFSGRPRRLNKTGVFLFLLAFLVAILGCLRAYPLVVSLISAI